VDLRPRVQQPRASVRIASLARMPAPMDGRCSGTRSKIACTRDDGRDVDPGLARLTCTALGNNRVDQAGRGLRARTRE
jgi:hypothetical protein